MVTTLRRLRMALLLAAAAATVGNAHAQEALAFRSGGFFQTLPKQAAKPTALTIDAFANAVEAWVKRDSQLRGGYFVVYDEAQRKSLSLKLDKVHRERLAKTGDQVYCTCAEFKTPEGTVYDLDLHMKGTSEADLVPAEITVHKQGGKPRYTWYEEGGIWKKRAAGESKPGS